MRIYFTAVITDKKANSLKELDAIKKKNVVATVVDVKKSEWLKLMGGVELLGKETFRELYFSWFKKK